MPLIVVKLTEGVFTPEQKREMVERLTDTMVSIQGGKMRSATRVLVEEFGGSAPRSVWPAIPLRGRRGQPLCLTRSDPVS
jgi:4-oxalocrotonate tautomerase family enzyme